MARTVGFDSSFGKRCVAGVSQISPPQHVEGLQPTLCDNIERRLERTTIFCWICQGVSPGEHPIAVIGRRWHAAAFERSSRPVVDF